MSLQRKFAALLVLFGLAVAGSIASALWSFHVIEREVARPFESMTTALRSLGKVKRAVESQADIMLGPPRFPDPEALDVAPAPQGVRGLRESSMERPASADEADSFERLAAEAAMEIDRLESLPTWRLRTGQYAASNLRARLEQATADARRWLGGDQDQARRSAGWQMYQIHELIERIETRILEDAALAEAFALRMRERLLLILGMVLVASTLVGVLSLFLVRRWVVRPIGELREAAVHIGRGDYAYRVRPSGQDELGRLGHEVNQMAVLIGQMLDERVESERLAAVGQMVRRLAHNIRNPLAGIRGLAETTREELDDADLREAQQRIIDAVDGFDRWLGDLLRETAPAEVHPEPTDVEPWLRGVVLAHEAMARARRVRLEVAIGEVGRRQFDPTHLEHAVAAVLANAAEASPEEGAVVVSAEGGEAEWCVRVADQGPGVPSDLQQRIFEPHFTTKRGGTGIGLAAAQQVVRMHGGRIGVENLDSGSEGGNGRGGACFTLTLPGGQVEDEVARIGQTEASSGQNPDHRRRGEPPLFDAEGVDARRP